MFLNSGILGSLGTLYTEGLERESAERLMWGPRSACLVVRCARLCVCVFVCLCVSVDVHLCFCGFGFGILG